MEVLSKLPILLTVAESYEANAELTQRSIQVLVDLHAILPENIRDEIGSTLPFVPLEVFCQAQSLS